MSQGQATEGLIAAFKPQPQARHRPKAVSTCCTINVVLPTIPMLHRHHHSSLTIYKPYGLSCKPRCLPQSTKCYASVCLLCVGGRVRNARHDGYRDRRIWRHQSQRVAHGVAGQETAKKKAHIRCCSAATPASTRVQCAGDVGFQASITSSITHQQAGERMQQAKLKSSVLQQGGGNGAGARPP